MTASDPTPRRGHGAEAWVERRVSRARAVYTAHGRVFRVLWIVTGFVIVLGGLAMTVLPGPATVVIPFGLVMLAVAFGWARRALLASVRGGADVSRRFREASLAVKLVTIGALVCVVAAPVAWFVLR